LTYIGFADIEVEVNKLCCQGQWNLYRFRKLYPTIFFLIINSTFQEEMYICHQILIEFEGYHIRSRHINCMIRTARHAGKLNGEIFSSQARLSVFNI